MTTDVVVGKSAGNKRSVKLSAEIMQSVEPASHAESSYSNRLPRSSRQLVDSLRWMLTNPMKTVPHAGAASEVISEII